MKSPHDKSEYTALDEIPSAADGDSPEPLDAEKPEPRPANRRKKPKFSGAYYYVNAEQEKLDERGFIRTVLTLIAFFLQIVILFLPAQSSLEYITLNITWYALFYVMTVFGMIVTSIWLIVMNKTRYKFRKRIPKEYAPARGFSRRAFFGAELFMAQNALLTAMQISFVCIVYDPITLVAVFISAAATAAAVCARQVTHITLRDSELIPAAPQDRSE